MSIRGDFPKTGEVLSKVITGEKGRSLEVIGGSS